MVPIHIKCKKESQQIALSHPRLVESGSRKLLSKHVATVERKNSSLTGRNLRQNLAQYKRPRPSGGLRKQRRDSMEDAGSPRASSGPMVPTQQWDIMVKQDTRLGGTSMRRKTLRENRVNNYNNRRKNISGEM